MRGHPERAGGLRGAGVRRFVHVGTEAALLAGQPLVDVDETAPLRPDSPALYSATKARAERWCCAANRAASRRWSSGRGSSGAGRHDDAAGDGGAGRAGRFAWIGGGGHRTSTTHVDNTVEGLRARRARAARPGNAYFVTDGEPVVFREFVSELLATQGVTAPTRSSRPRSPRRWPPPARRPGGCCPCPAAHRSPASPTGWPRRSARSGSTRPASELGYEPIISIPEGLAAMRENAG